jgi:aspartate aminotransferase
MIYSKEELASIIEFCSKNNIYIISDEIYERIVFSKYKFYSTAAISKAAYDITITVNGLSKSHAMTGWRVGYLACSKELAAMINNIQSHFLSHIASFIQEASVFAISFDSAVVPMLEAYEERLKLACDLLDKYLPNLKYIKPEGAFYIFPNVSYYYGKKYNDKLINNSLDLSELILEEAKVAVVPGIAFGADDSIRISLAASIEDINNGILFIAKILNCIK